MISFIQILLYTIFYLSLLYLLLILLFTFGWLKLKSGFEPETKPKTRVSVVIAVRNEGKNIQKLLEALAGQVYPKEMMEVLIVDDHSEDNTVEIVKDFAALHKELRLNIISSRGNGKKQAVSTGIHNASGDFILTTDGDTRPSDRWVRKMTAYHETFHPKLILGPVVYSKEDKMIQRFFSLDFISLVATGAGAAGAGIPFMGNAANMGFERSVFNDGLQENFASGDDVFLIHHVKKNYGRKSIHFLKDPHAVVETPPPQNIRNFILQRLRWGSKAKGYKDLFSILTSMTVFVLNSGLALLFVTALFYHWLFPVWILFILLKTLVDLPLLQGFARLTGKTRLLILTFPFEFIYPFYITLTGLLAIFGKYEWKGRKNLS